MIPKPRFILHPGPVRVNDEVIHISGNALTRNYLLTPSDDFVQYTESGWIPSPADIHLFPLESGDYTRVINAEMTAYRHRFNRSRIEAALTELQTLHPNEAAAIEEWAIKMVERVREPKGSYHRVELSTVLTPTNGAKAIVDHWWLTLDGHPLAWVEGTLVSPQCNEQKQLVEGLAEHKGDGYSSMFIPLAFWNDALVRTGLG